MAGSEAALGLALGHVRNVTASLMAREDDTGEASFLAAQCVEIEGLLADLGAIPEFVEEGLDAASSLTRASMALASADGAVPLVARVAVRSLLARVS